MFKNRALQVKVVKSTDENGAVDSTAVVPHIDPEDINKIAREQAKNIAVAVSATIISSMLAKTASEVIIHTAKTKIR